MNTEELKIKIGADVYDRLEKEKCLHRGIFLFQPPVGLEHHFLYFLSSLFITVIIYNE